MDTDDIAFFRLKQIVGDLKADPPIDPLLPIGRSSWWAGVKAGRCPTRKAGTTDDCMAAARHRQAD